MLLLIFLLCTTMKENDGFIFITEEMIRGLQRLGWKKVDVSFHSAFWPFFAHNNINVRVTEIYYYPLLRLLLIHPCNLIS